MNSIRYFNYLDALEIQHQLWKSDSVSLEPNQRIRTGFEMDFFVFEANPVYTYGSRCEEKNLLSRYPHLRFQSIPLLQVDRGGDITFHGPGQILLFPIPAFSVREVERIRTIIHRGPRFWINQFQSYLFHWGTSQGLRLKAVEGFPGIFYRPGEKLASIGLRINRNGIFHGLALNVEKISEKGFDSIHPCGLGGVQATSLEGMGSQIKTVADFGISFQSHFSEFKSDAVAIP